MPTQRELAILNRTAMTGYGLNLGCGNNRLGNAIGIDSNPTATAADILADICKLDMYKDNTFDYIIASAVLEHVSVAPILALREWARVLKLNGTLHILVPDAEYGIWSMTGDSGAIGLLVSPPGMEHLHAFTKESLEVLLMFAGYAEIDIMRFNRLPERRERTLIARAVKGPLYAAN